MHHIRLGKSPFVRLTIEVFLRSVNSPAPSFTGSTFGRGEGPSVSSASSLLESLPFVQLRRQARSS